MVNDGKIKWIIFDFDEVISKSFYWYNLLLEEINKKISLDVDKGIKFLIKNARPWFTGVWDEHKMLKELNNNLHVKIPFKLFDNAFHKTLLPDRKVLSVIMRLKKKGYKLGILTDNPKIRVKKLSSHKNLSGVFHKITGSAYLKKTKKDKSVFNDLCRLLKVKTKNVLFIDDNEENCKNAGNVGINVINFKLGKNNRKRLLTQINKYGCLLTIKVENQCTPCAQKVRNSRTLQLAIF